MRRLISLAVICFIITTSGSPIFAQSPQSVQNESNVSSAAASGSTEAGQQLSFIELVARDGDYGNLNSQETVSQPEAKPVETGNEALSVNVTPIKADVKIVVNGKSIRSERMPVSIEGRVLGPARTVFSNLGASIDWYETKNLIEITRGNTRVSMKIGDTSALVNDESKKMDVPAILVDGVVMVPLRFISESLKSGIWWDGGSKTVYIGRDGRGDAASRGGDREKFVVVIDAGHGGKESGAVYGGIKEKDLNLDIAKRVNELLEKEGIKTYMTREDDTYVGLYARTKLANSVKADLFLSIHNNAEDVPRTSGTMTLYSPKGNDSNGNLTAKEFAKVIQKELVKDLGTKNLGVVPRPELAVLRTADMPAVIAEVGYMTDRNELKRLKSASFKQDAAEALKDAVLAALDEI